MTRMTWGATDPETLTYRLPLGSSMPSFGEAVHALWLSAIGAVR
jgi:hypothetical protein